MTDKKTLRELYDALGDGDTTAEDAYIAARILKVAEIADAIRDDLKQPDYAEATAEAIMASAEETGRIEGDEIDGEVAGRYTKSGNPIPVTI